MSPRKVKLVADLIRGSSVKNAEVQLRFAKKMASVPVAKLLKSAVANAENNFSLKKENLFVKTIYANEGPMLKRWRARAFGRAGSILKRMCHVTIVLDEIPSAEKKAVAEKIKTVKTEEKKIVKKIKKTEKK
jgi:large subunit ribosomal protein L22